MGRQRVLFLSFSSNECPCRYYTRMQRHGHPCHPNIERHGGVLYPHRGVLLQARQAVSKVEIFSEESPIGMAIISLQVALATHLGESPCAAGGSKQVRSRRSAVPVSVAPLSSGTVSHIARPPITLRSKKRAGRRSNKCAPKEEETIECNQPCRGSKLSFSWPFGRYSNSSSSTRSSSRVLKSRSASMPSHHESLNVVGSTMRRRSRQV